jgi:hypothetical protein
MTQDNESVVMEPMTDLVSLGSRGNGEPMDASIPEAMTDEVNKLHTTFN